MEALNARKMETDENSSGALGAGENGGGSHQLQSPGSAREPLVEISTSKSDCTENCNRSNCGFLFDDRLNNSDANMVCVPVDEDMEGEPPSKTQQISGGGAEGVQLRRRVRERKRASNGEARHYSTQSTPISPVVFCAACFRYRSNALINQREN